MVWNCNGCGNTSLRCFGSLKTGPCSFTLQAAFVTFNRTRDQRECLKLTPNPGFQGGDLLAFKPFISAYAFSLLVFSSSHWFSLARACAQAGCIARPWPRMLSACRPSSAFIFLLMLHASCLLRHACIFRLAVQPHRGQGCSMHAWLLHRDHTSLRTL